MNMEKIVSYFNRMGFKPDLTNFDDRLRIQKIIYLLKLKGFKINFNFGYYIRGPHSPTLTDEIFKQKKEFNNLKEVNLNKKECEEIDYFINVFKELSPSLLEIAAIYSYFITSQKLSHQEAYKKVRQKKSFYSPSLISNGVSKAKQFLQFATEEEILNMKKEFSGWESITLEDEIKLINN